MNKTVTTIMAILLLVIMLGSSIAAIVMQFMK